MGRPTISLKDWCLQDGELKAKFVKKESEKPSGLIIKNHRTYFTNPNLNTIKLRADEYEQIGILNNGMNIQITPMCYEKLRAKYRVFKKAKKDKGLIKKQYLLSSEAIQIMQEIKINGNKASEAQVIEYLCKTYNNDTIKEAIPTKIQSNRLKVQTLQEELNHAHLKNLEKQNTIGYQDNQINKLLDLLARAYLLNDDYKEFLEEKGITFNRSSFDEKMIEDKIYAIKRYLGLNLY